MSYDYFYGQSGELFSYYRIPKALFQDSRFRQLSTDAKTLYGILLDRMSLSVKNGWLDEQNRVFIIFTIEDVKRALCCADNKATKLLRELEKFGLIERKRRGQGKPSLVYVKNFSAESSKESVKNRDNDDSCGSKIACQDPVKSRGIKKKENKTEMNNTNPILSDESEKLKDRELLEEYEKILADYEGFESELPVLISREEKVLKELRPIMSDTSKNFRPHNIDSDRFEEITSKISTARSKYEKFGILREALLSSKDTYDYLAALDMLTVDGTVPAEFSRKLSPIAELRREIKTGQAVEFADLDAIANLPDAFSTPKAVLPESKTLTSLYRYTTESGSPVYTIAQVSERTQKWSGGYTTVQEAKEISLGGNITSTRYMKSKTSGREPVGDLLTGGALTPESLVGVEVFKTAASKSLLDALAMIANSNVNPAYKAYLEKIIIEKLKAKPVETGFAYSPSAKAHADKVLKNTSGMFDYSWIFEKDSKLKYLKSELYSEVLPDFEKEAHIFAKAVEIAESSPLELVGIVLENGKMRLFKEPKGALWGVSKKGFGRLASKNDAIALSPVFSETISSKEIISKAKEK